MIKEYFANYFLHNSDVTFDISLNRMEVHQQKAEPWKVTLVDTGENTSTGGRLKRVQKYVEQDKFCFTYGDGVSDVNIAQLLSYHRSQGCWATLTTVQPPGRYGSLALQGNMVTSFKEKPRGDGGWINGGFFILEPAVFNVISGDESSWESECLPKIASQGQLAAYRHTRFWQSMDTLRDKRHLENIWASGNIPWQVWS